MIRLQFSGIKGGDMKSTTVQVLVWKCGENNVRT